LYVYARAVAGGDAVTAVAQYGDKRLGDDALIDARVIPAPVEYSERCRLSQLAADAEHVGGLLVDVPTLLERVQHASVLRNCRSRSPFAATVVDCDMDVSIVSDHASANVGGFAGEVLHVGFR